MNPWTILAWTTALSLSTLTITIVTAGITGVIKGHHRRTHNKGTRII